MEIKTRRKVCAVTGTRAEYGVLRPLLKAIEACPALELSLIVTGMHLSHEFGYTVQEIERDGFKIESRVDMEIDTDAPATRARALARAISGITDSLEIRKPEILLVTGDRGEMLAGALAAVYLDIVVAHISGGDVSGDNVDNSIRHAITKLAHIHFPATGEAARRIIKMGENPRYVFPVGNPGVPPKIEVSRKERDRIAQQFHLDLDEPVLIVIQHPVEFEQAAAQMRETMEAIKELKLPTIVIYPNVDPGSRGMIRVINQYKHLPFIQVYKNIPREDFLSLMSVSSALIGNSSCALIEAPSCNLPAVNIGSRQQGRERGNNIIDVNPVKAEIVSAINRALNDEEFRTQVKESTNPYAMGGTESQIVKILSEIKLSSKLLQKKFYD
jgi:GDP/UDP-N,N'-diacetylbacillosamine 2-epimerase (hydrolysing)